MGYPYSLKDLLPEIVILADRAGEAVMAVYSGGDLGTTYKKDDSPLTRADVASHHIIVDELQKLTPEWLVLSEESKSLPYAEREVLMLIATGLSNRDIATQFNRATKTIDSHREHIMNKLKIDSIAGLTKYAIRHGLATVS